MTFRVNKTRDYTILSNYHLRDKKLSLKAKGLLSLLLSLPDDWDYSVAGLTTLTLDCKHSISSGLKELETYGYLVRTQKFKANGLFDGYIYDVYEQPFTENPSTDNASTDNPLTGNSTQHNKDIRNNVKNKYKERVGLTNYIQRDYSDDDYNHVFEDIDNFDNLEI